MKKYTTQSQSGDAGMALIHQLVNAMGFVWHPRQVDHGIDGEIELVDRRAQRPINRVIFAQSKSRERFPGEDDSSFHFVCDEADITYWSEGNVPVILICSHPTTGEAWWSPVSEMFKDPARLLNRRVDFDKQRDRLDERSASRLLDLAVPLSDSLYVPSAPRSERLTSNLLVVEQLPDTIWAAPSTASGNKEAWEVLRRRRHFAGDWMVADRTVFSFRRPDQGPLSCIVDGSAEAIDVAEWADAKCPGTVRDFVRLLKQTLAEDHHRVLRRHTKHHYLYFKPADDLTARRLLTGKSKSGRVVFRAYPDADDPANAKHFRHHALDHQFVRLDGAWFLSLSPTYHFTTDGYRDLPWGSDLVDGMKRREKNGAVRALVDMWAVHFRGVHGLFDEHGPRSDLRFGALAMFDVERGIDEQTWLEERPDADPTPCSDATLFEV